MIERLKQVRKDAKLTQEAFAEKIGLTRNFVAQVETGSKEFSDRTLRDICREFNINETWLRTGAGEMKSENSRAAEMAEAIKSLLSDRPASFQTALITTLLRFDPDGPEWELLEAIYNSVAEEMETPTDEKKP